jgi:GNAT superfamily N-acetyltransferase
VAAPDSTGLSFRTGYWNDTKARAAFIDFIRTIHNVDFTEWDAAGYWDDDYIPFSWFAGNRLVANACVYTMPAIVGGEACRIAQISGVGTAPEYRRRGLNRKLHEAALAFALRDHRFAFLFSDEDAMPFYAKVGFVRVADHAPFVRLAGTAPRGGLERIDLGSKPELDALYELACARAPLSEVLSNFNPKLLMYHAIYTLREHAWRIPALGATVFMKRSGAKTIVYDVLARDLPDFDSLYPYLSSGTAEEFEFRFPTDRLEIAGAQLREVKSNAHVIGADAPDQWVFPFTAHA